MSNSSLVNIKVPAHSNNYTVGRSGRKIEKIAIHHMAGILTAKQCGGIFQNGSRKASSNYGIGKDAEVGLYVDEENTSYCNSNWDSNCKSVTIETSNSSLGGNYPVSDAVLNKLIELVADIAKRNNLGKLVKGQNLVWHRMYAATTCPGDYLLSKMDYIAEQANKINNIEKPAENTNPTSSEGYLVKVTADVLNIRADAGTNYAVVGQIKDHGVYTIVAEKEGTGASKWGKLKSGAGWISLDYVEKISSGKVETITTSSKIEKGNKVKVKQGAKTYTGGNLASFVYSTIYDVIEVNGDRVVIGKGKTVTAAIHKNNLIKV
ncbi:MAG: N-acetylmuramoyl-L-alanine amidase [Clostridia bacterium]|nr:N-acetylmuramoyl-L-alanine amidase [Clostridia bacterium]